MISHTLSRFCSRTHTHTLGFHHLNWVPGKKKSEGFLQRRSKTPPFTLSPDVTRRWNAAFSSLIPQTSHTGARFRGITLSVYITCNNTGVCIYQATPFFFLWPVFLAMRWCLSFLACLWLIHTGYCPCSFSRVSFFRLLSVSIRPISPTERRRETHEVRLFLVILRGTELLPQKGKFIRKREK